MSLLLLTEEFDRAMEKFLWARKLFRYYDRTGEELRTIDFFKAYAVGQNGTRALSVSLTSDLGVAYTMARFGQTFCRPGLVRTPPDHVRDLPDIPDGYHGYEFIWDDEAMAYQIWERKP